MVRLALGTNDEYFGGLSSNDELRAKLRGELGADDATVTGVPCPPFASRPAVPTRVVAPRGGRPARARLEASRALVVQVTSDTYGHMLDGVGGTSSDGRSGPDPTSFDGGFLALA